MNGWQVVYIVTKNETIRGPVFRYEALVVLVLTRVSIEIGGTVASILAALHQAEPSVIAQLIAASRQPRFAQGASES